MDSDSTNEDFVSELRQAVQGEVFTGQVVRGIYATDASHYQQMPRCVLVPQDEADVITAVKLCAKHRVPITPRGGGTALSGQSFGPGLVIDLSKNINRVLEINEAEGWAIVQAGAVRDHVNAKLQPFGFHFAPDPATTSRATIGGMIGNNTSGTRSIVYGKTIDHVLECKFILSDGTVMEVGPCSDQEWQTKADGDDQSARVYREIKTLVETHEQEILARYPKVMRRVSGYNLDEFVDGAGYTGDIGPRSANNQGKRTWNLANLVVGSEGTLAFLLSAKIRLTPNPKATALCVVHFDDDIDSLAAVPSINRFGPSAVEMLDRGVLVEAQMNPATKHMSGWIQGDPAAVMITEFFGDDADDANRKAAEFADAMSSQSIGYSHPLITVPDDQKDVWETRKLGLGLISNVAGPTKGQAFVEDACVPVEVLAEYIKRLRDCCDELDVETTLYAHASVGVIHFRPALDLHQQDQIDKMRLIADRAFEMVVEYGGIFAGEHGDGQLRGEYIPKFFGDKLYEAFREVKRIFDPAGLMNPGKIVDAPPMTDKDSLRYGTRYKMDEVESQFHYRDQGGFRLAVEQCNGVGACRKVGGGTMCPSYMATRNEQDTTRGRANALRLAMSGQLDLAQDDPHSALASDEVHDVLDLCLECKACKTECPNSVDMSRLKSDALQMRHDKQGISLAAKILGRMPDQARKLAGKFHWLPKIVIKTPGSRLALEKSAGIDRRRALPAFADKNLDQLLASRESKSPSQSASRQKVVLFNDTFHSYMEPQVGLAAVELLEQLGYEVIVAGAGCCQRTRISKGLLREAKQGGLQTMKNLASFARQGLPILCLEPSCASSLMQDLPDLIDDTELGTTVAQQVKMIDQFLADENVDLKCDASSVLLHGHCHQKAVFGTGSIHELFAKIENTELNEVDSGCCGMAGSFGYEHYDLSQQIGEDRLFPAVRDAIKEGKSIVACGISCRHQLRDFLDVEAKHFVEVVSPRE